MNIGELYECGAKKHKRGPIKSFFRKSLYIFLSPFFAELLEYIRQLQEKIESVENHVESVENHLSSLGLGDLCKRQDFVERDLEAMANRFSTIEAFLSELEKKMPCP